MSKIALSGPAGGTATYTVTAPTGATDRTLTLPDQTATLITDSAGVLNIGSGQIYKDASGNVGIGTSSPDIFSRGDQRNVAIAAAGASDNLALALNAGGSAGRGAQIYMGQGGTRHLTLTSNVNESTVETTSSTPLKFGTNSTERARIDSSGNLLVGKTTSGNSVGVQLEPNGGSSFIRSSSSNSDLNLYVYSTGAGAARFYVGMGGQVYATSTSISAISDRTLKENIRDLETGLTEVMALKPRRFDWKNGDAQNVAGFVAQEVEEVLPELVTDYVYNKSEDGNDIIKKSLRMGDILPTLVKAIQEQQALIQSLTDRITALEGTQP